MYGTQLLEKPQTTDSGREDFAHIADAAKVTEAYVLGLPIEALCGKVFIPSKNPENLEVCPTCKEIANALFIQYSL